MKVTKNTLAYMAMVVVACGSSYVKADLIQWTVASGGNGHWYGLTTVTTWISAESDAVSLGGHLVTINNQAENDWLVQTFGGDEVFFIGITDKDHEGTWTWISGDGGWYVKGNINSTSFASWCDGEPNNSGPGEEDYGWFNWAAEPGNWNDGAYDGANHGGWRGIVEIVPEPATLGLLTMSGMVFLKRRKV